MYPSLTSLLAVVPDLLPNHKLRIDRYGNPVLVVTFKKTEGKLAVTTEPEIDTTGITEKLNPWLFAEGDTYELEFSKRRCLISRHNGNQVDAYNFHCFIDFLNQFAGRAFDLAEALNKVLEGLPSADKISKALRESVDHRLMEAFAKKDGDFLTTGPTIIQVFSPEDAELAQISEALDVMGVLEEAGAPDFVKAIFGVGIAATEAKRIRLRMMASNPNYIVMASNVDGHHPFFGLVASLMTKVAQTMLPDIFEERRCDLECMVDAAYEAMHPEMYEGDDDEQNDEESEEEEEFDSNGDGQENPAELEAPITPDNDSTEGELATEPTEESSAGQS